MNKRFFINTLAALMLATPAFASYQAVPRAQVAQYAEASLLAIQSLNLNCNDRGVSTHLRGIHLMMHDVGYGYGVDAEKVTEAYVNSAGAQPLIKLVASPGSDTRVELEIETNVTRTEVISFKKTSFRSGRINTGTLDNPNVINGWVQQSSFECRIQ